MQILRLLTVHKPSTHPPQFTPRRKSISMKSKSSSAHDERGRGEYQTRVFYRRGSLSPPSFVSACEVLDEVSPQQLSSRAGATPGPLLLLPGSCVASFLFCGTLNQVAVLTLS